MKSSARRYVMVPITLLLLFLLTFSIFAEGLVAHQLNRFDSTVIDWIQSRIDPMNTRIMEFLTFVGSPEVVAMLVVLSVVLFYWTGKRWEAFGMLTANVAGFGFNELLKVIFHRQRPDIHRLVTAHGYSFPSGHSMGSVVFYGMVSYFVCLFAKSTFLKVLTCISSALLIVFIGVSRIYLGVHYPSDVIAGFAAGGAWLVICATGLHYIVKRRHGS